MIIQLVGKAGLAVFFGLSSDTKPTTIDGFMFIEIDTAKTFIRASGVWTEVLNSSYEPAGTPSSGSGAPAGLMPLDYERNEEFQLAGPMIAPHRIIDYVAHRDVDAQAEVPVTGSLLVGNGFGTEGKWEVLQIPLSVNALLTSDGGSTFWTTTTPSSILITNFAGELNFIPLNSLSVPPGLDGEDGIETIPIPGPQGPQGIPGVGGGGSATIVEKDLGSTPTWRGKFTITDAAISATSKVLVWQAPGPYTGKGTRADEAEMQPVSIIAVEPASGSAQVFWETPPMITRCMMPASQYLQTGVTNIVTNPKDPQSYSRGFAKRLGKVRGNVKFSYTIFA